MKVIKFASYQQVGAAVKAGMSISPDEDRAMADFRGFYPVARVHTFRIENVGVLDTLLEITEQMRSDLLEQKKRFTNIAKVM